MKHQWESINRENYSRAELSCYSLKSETECALDELSSKEVDQAIAALDRAAYETFAQYIVTGFQRMAMGNQ